jgi:hypothetical protein
LALDSGVQVTSTSSQQTVISLDVSAHEIALTILAMTLMHVRAQTFRISQPLRHLFNLMMSEAVVNTFRFVNVLQFSEPASNTSDVPGRDYFLKWTLLRLVVDSHSQLYGYAYVGGLILLSGDSVLGLVLDRLGWRCSLLVFPPLYDKNIRSSLSPLDI